MTIYSLNDVSPTFPNSENYWIAPDANIVGDVRIEEWVSIWFGSTLRGDNEPILIGNGSNIQEGCILHTDIGFPLTIASDCTVGHKVILHGCTIGQGSLIGMGSTLLNGSVVGEYSVVGAGSLITEGKEFASRSLILGSPSKFIRKLSDDDISFFIKAATHYKDNIFRYRNGLKQIN